MSETEIWRAHHHRYDRATCVQAFGDGNAGDFVTNNKATTLSQASTISQF